jgi:hypothetical protein
MYTFSARLLQTTRCWQALETIDLNYITLQCQNGEREITNCYIRHANVTLQLNRLGGKHNIFASRPQDIILFRLTNSL